jgi:hypothetical protein
MKSFTTLEASSSYTKVLQNIQYYSPSMPCPCEATVAILIRVYIVVTASDAAYNLDKTGQDDRHYSIPASFEPIESTASLQFGILA